MNNYIDDGEGINWYFSRVNPKKTKNKLTDKPTSHNILELDNVLVEIRLTSSKTKCGV